MTSCNAEKLTKGKQLILHLLRKQSCSSVDNMLFVNMFHVKTAQTQSVVNLPQSFVFKTRVCSAPITFSRAAVSTQLRRGLNPWQCGVLLLISALTKPFSEVVRLIVS